MEDRIKKIVTDREWLTNWLSDAFYSSPWFEVSKYYPPSTSSSDVCREEKWVSALLNGGYIVVDDPEENKRHKVTLEDIIKGFGKFIFDCPEQYANMMTENYDFYDADCLLQIVIFGEVTYA